MANYEVDPALLEKYIPKHTETDLWNGKCYVSLVGFMFVNTKVRGVKIPFHINFEEVNLRFYVKHKGAEGWKRGVVFVREIVPRRALTLVANALYGENYVTMPMKHTWRERPDMLSVEYAWKKERWHTMKVVAENKPIDIIPGSEEEFITEHFWGYTRITEEKTSEYEVAHPTWQIYPLKSSKIEVDFGKIYGSDFAFLDHIAPASVFLAEGSGIEVRQGEKVRITIADLAKEHSINNGKPGM